MLEEVAAPVPRRLAPFVPLVVAPGRLDQPGPGDECGHPFGGLPGVVGVGGAAPEDEGGDSELGAPRASGAPGRSSPVRGSRPSIHCSRVAMNLRGSRSRKRCRFPGLRSMTSLHSGSSATDSMPPPHAARIDSPQ